MQCGNICLAAEMNFQPLGLGLGLGLGLELGLELELGVGGWVDIESVGTGWAGQIEWGRVP